MRSNETKITNLHYTVEMNKYEKKNMLYSRKKNKRLKLDTKARLLMKLRVININLRDFTFTYFYVLFTILESYKSYKK